MDRRYLLSICIGVYNTCDPSMQLIKTLLSIDSDDLQIVISDNASTDGFLNMVYGIKDNRLKILTNEKNIGPQPNWLKAMDNADGDFIFLSMARDRINPEAIKIIMKVLERTKYSVLYAGTMKNIRGFRRARYEGKIINYSKVDAYCELLAFDHPTGTIFRRSEFLKIHNREKYFVSGNSYPENYIKHGLITNGGGATVFYINTYDGQYGDRTVYKSKFHNKNEGVLFFFPSERVKEMIKILKMIRYNETLTKKEKNKIYRSRWLYLLKIVTVSWKNANRDASWINHYELPVRKVPFIEMINNMIMAKERVQKELQFDMIMRLFMFLSIPYMIMWIPTRELYHLVIDKVEHR